MKALKDLGVKFADLKGAVKVLNETGFAAKKLVTVGVKGPVVLASFLSTIGELTDEQLGAMPKILAKFYDSLPDTVFEDEGAEAGTDDGTDEQAGEVQDADNVSDCPVYGKQNTKEPECKSCKKDTPDEFKACKKETKSKAAKKDADKAKKAAPKGPGKKTRYGHNPGSMGGDIDNMVWEGNTMKKMVSHLVKNHDRDETQAEAKINGHMRWLKNKKGITVTMAEKGKKYKADLEFMEGRNADNTMATKADK